MTPKPVEGFNPGLEAVAFRHGEKLPQRHVDGLVDRGRLSRVTEPAPGQVDAGRSVAGHVEVLRVGDVFHVVEPDPGADDRRTGSTQEYSDPVPGESRSS